MIQELSLYKIKVYAQIEYFYNFNRNFLTFFGRPEYNKRGLP